MDRYEAMKIFVRVAELRSFTRAAELLNLPKATVSTSIQDLEGLVGTKLLHRTTRQVELSPEGASFLERCKDLLSDLEEAQSMFRAEAGQISGKIRVDMVASLARNVLLPELPKFLGQHPGIQIELSNTDRRVDLIREGIDCVIRGGTYSDRGLAERDLGKLTLVNCVSPDYIAKHGKPRNLEDLKGHKLLCFAQVLGAKPDGFEYFDGEKYRELKMSSSLTMNNSDAYVDACLAGLGICQNPLVAVEKHLKNGELIEILPKFRAQPMNVKLVYLERRILAKRVRVFIDWLEPIMNKYIR